MPNGRRGRTPPEWSRGRGGRPKPIEEILPTAIRELGLPNLLKTPRWKPPQTETERKLRKLLRKRLRFLLPKKEIEDIIAAKGRKPKWLVDVIEIFNDVDRKTNIQLTREIANNITEEYKCENDCTNHFNSMRSLAQKDSPSEQFFGAGKSFLQSQQSLFINSLQLTIRKFVQKTRKNRGKINSEEYREALDHIQKCLLFSEMDKMILNNQNIFRKWAEEQFDEMKKERR